MVRLPVLSESTEVVGRGPDMVDFLRNCRGSDAQESMRRLSLIDRQIAIFDRQREDGHRRAVVPAAGAVVAVAGEPAPVLALVVEQDRDELGIIGEEVLVAHLEHGLRAVVDLVEEVRAGPLGRVLEQVLGAGDGLGRQVLAADLQGEDAGAGPGVVRAAAGLVAEAASLRTAQRLR